MLSSLIIPLTSAQLIILSVLTVVASIAACNYYTKYGLEKMSDLTSDHVFGAISFCLSKVVWLMILSTSIGVYANAINFVDFFQTYFICGLTIAFISTLFFITKIARVINIGKREYTPIIRYKIKELIKHSHINTKASGEWANLMQSYAVSMVRESISNKNLLISSDFIKLDSESNLQRWIDLEQKNYSKYTQDDLVDPAVDSFVESIKIIPKIEWQKMRADWFIWVTFWPVYVLVPVVWVFRKTITAIFTFSLNKFFTIVLKKLLK